jgi:hypothetical protein
VSGLQTIGNRESIGKDRYRLLISGTPVWAPRDLLVFTGCVYRVPVA